MSKVNYVMRIEDFTPMGYLEFPIENWGFQGMRPMGVGLGVGRNHRLDGGAFMIYKERKGVDFYSHLFTQYFAEGKNFSKATITTSFHRISGKPDVVSDRRYITFLNLKIIDIRPGVNFDQIDFSYDKIREPSAPEEILVDEYQ